MTPYNPHINDRDLGLGPGQSEHSVLYSTEIDDENNGNLVKRCWNEMVYHFMWAFIQENCPKKISQSMQKFRIRAFSGMFLGCSACSYVVLGLFLGCSACSWLVLGLFRLFLGCSRGVPSFSQIGKFDMRGGLIPCTLSRYPRSHPHICKICTNGTVYLLVLYVKVVG